MEVFLPTNTEIIAFFVFIGNRFYNYSLKIFGNKIIKNHLDY